MEKRLGVEIAAREERQVQTEQDGIRAGKLETLGAAPGMDPGS